MVSLVVVSHYSATGRRSDKSVSPPLWTTYNDGGGPVLGVACPAGTYSITAGKAALWDGRSRTCEACGQIMGWGVSCLALGPFCRAPKQSNMGRFPFEVLVHGAFGRDTENAQNVPGIPSLQLTWKCTDPGRKATFLLEIVFLPFPC